MDGDPAGEFIISKQDPNNLKYEPCNAELWENVWHDAPDVFHSPLSET